MKKTFFGMTGNGEAAYLYTLTEGRGITAEVTSYGASLCRLKIMDKDGNAKDVVLGYDDAAGYEKNTGTYFGATIGRNANRIANASFTMDEVTYRLEKNNGRHNLHSGSEGFSHRLWKEGEATENSITFSLNSPDMDQGFPGELYIEVTYMLTGDELRIIYNATSKGKAFLNMTNHSYFNLNGHAAGSIAEHEMWIDSDMYLEPDRQLIPTGKRVDVKNTPMDFREYKKIGEDFDHNWILKNDGVFKKAAGLYSQTSGIGMEVFTDMPGIQIYTGNAIENEKGKQGAVYRKNQGVCFETQYFPNSINEPGFEIALLEDGEKFQSETAFRFSIR